jgi:uncharacterized protein YbbC (DUF1343 family)
MPMKPSLAILFLSLLTFPGFAQDNFYDYSIMPADKKPASYVKLLRNKRVALVINHTSVIGNTSVLDQMLNNKVQVIKIFVPEHGFRGNADAGAHIENTTDSATGLPVISLYGNHKKPTVQDLSGVDVVVYDLQDVGVRFYTYISTLEYCMEACAENKVSFVVLDRPNPNGFYVDGPVLEKENKSFVGMQQIPIVYGMTPGEYAGMIKGEGWFNKAAELDLHVVKCVNYTHSKKYKVPVAPSPNLRTMAAIYAYPSLCLFEGTPISVGRGTDVPFQVYGCPQFSAAKFPYKFTPVSGYGAKAPPHENKVCNGELVGSNATEVLKKVNNKFQVSWLVKAYKAYPEKEKFFTPFFTKLSGTKQLQEAIKRGDAEKTIRGTWAANIAAFKKIRKKYLLYPDFE